jgi:hypothetical protein
MNRIKLGLFGAVRPSHVSADAQAPNDPRSAEAQDRLAGLTPVEIATVEAMARTEGAVLAVR